MALSSMNNISFWLLPPSLLSLLLSGFGMYEWWAGLKLYLTALILLVAMWNHSKFFLSLNN